MADTLWLAARIESLKTRETGAEQELPKSTGAKQEPDTEPVTSSSTTRMQQQRTKPLRDERVARLHAYERPHHRSAAPTEGGGGASPFRAPAVTPLPNALQLSRALRPLRRRGASHVECTLDEEGTVNRIAEEDLWIPVFRPKSEPWLELYLVVDRYSSMEIWQPAIVALRRLLERQGTFRNVGLWWLDGQGDGEPDRGLCLRDESGRSPRSNQALLDDNGRRVIWVLSDCIAPYWRNEGPLRHLFRGWSRRNPLALVHLLPQRMWAGSGLGETPVVNLRAGAPGLPNAKLEAAEQLWQKRASRLPVLTLDPHALATWAALLLGRREVWCTGIAFGADGEIRSEPVAHDEVSVALSTSARDRLDLFRASVSPEAQRLALLFSPLPLTLPIMRLAQHILLPGSRLTHLAGFFLGGLLRRADLDFPEDEREKDPLKIPFDYLPDVRDILLDSLPTPEVEAIGRRISVAVEQRLGQVADFFALLADPTAKGEVPLNAKSLLFAKVRLKVFRRLSGTYATLAADLAEAIAAAEERYQSIGPYKSEDLDGTTGLHDRFLDSGPGARDRYLGFRISSTCHPPDGCRSRTASLCTRYVQPRRARAGVCRPKSAKPPASGSSGEGRRGFFCCAVFRRCYLWLPPLY